MHRPPLLVLGAAALAGCAFANPPAPAPLQPASVLGDAAPRRFARELPDFALRDPHGRQYRDEDLVDRGLVLVVTAPILSNREAQEGWAEALERERPSDDVGRFVFLEDMSPSWFEGTALERMREDDDPDAPPILLIDPEGEVREALGAEEKETVVLVYGPDRGLLRVEQGEPSSAAARRAWAALDRAPPSG